MLQYTHIPIAFAVAVACGNTDDTAPPPPSGPDTAPAEFDLEAATVRYDAELDHLVFTLDVAGEAGANVPAPAGQLDGAPVYGYVFPTTLASTDVGFGVVSGIVALALTSHPDFDDTPL